MALTIRKITTMIKGKNYSSFNLHRWGNHLNNECTERIEQCMSIQWNDYSCLTVDKKILIQKNKEIDDKYGEKIKKHLAQIKTKQNSIYIQPRVSIIKKNKSPYLNYLDSMDMRASMLF